MRKIKPHNVNILHVLTEAGLPAKSFKERIALIKMEVGSNQQ